MPEKKIAGSVIVTVAKTVSGTASITLTVYVPAHKLTAVAVVCAGLEFHEYVYGNVPPAGVAVAEPTQTLLQGRLTVSVIDTNSACAKEFSPNIKGIRNIMSSFFTLILCLICCSYEILNTWLLINLFRFVRSNQTQATYSGAFRLLINKCMPFVK